MATRASALLAAALLVGAAITWNGAAAAAEPPGGQVWVATHRGGQTNEANASVASPDGATVFVTGVSGDDSQYGTIAIDSATGARRWFATYRVSQFSQNVATAIAVSPDGARVFVTGRSNTGAYGTVAYAAATGTQLWATTHNGDEAAAIVVSPDGTRVFTTGTGQGVGRRDMSTVAYNAATGAKLWTVAYNGPANLDDRARSIAVNPAGTRVVVTGTATNAQRGNEYLTLSYRASDGARSWFARYNHVPGNRSDTAARVVMSHSGEFVVVTGSSQDDASTADVESATVAYRTATGEQLWASRVDHASYRNPTDLAISLDDTRVFVTGVHSGVPGSRLPTGNVAGDYVTTALDATSGAEVWDVRYDGAGLSDEARALALSEDGSQVVVTGTSSSGFVSHFDLVTVAYDAASGTQTWASARIYPARWGPEVGNDVVVLPGRNQVVSSGWVQEANNYPPNYLMVAHAL